MQSFGVDDVLITFPLDGDEIQALDSEHVRLTNDIIGSSVVVGRGILDVLEFFEDGATLAALASAFELDEARARALLEPLIDSFIIVRWQDLPWLRWGISRPCLHGVGTRTRLVELRRTEEVPDFVVFGVALDLGGNPGSRRGPGLLRRRLSVPSSAGDAVLDCEAERTLTGFPRVVDLGNVAYMGGESMEMVGHRISLIVRESWKRDITPVMLGGDHSWTHFPLRELIATREDFGIIHFGAQADVYPMRHGLLTNGNVFLPALESPKLRCLLQLGLRGLVTSYGKLGFVGDERVRYIPARRLETSSPERVFAQVPRDLPYYVTFDATALDVSETAEPVIGGLSHHTGVSLFAHLCRNFRVIGADFVEVAGSTNGRNRAAESTARCIFELMASRANAGAIASCDGK
ncbi:arginase family protein [Paraliomyxa miuraensis]|uniref:arginase family protein n=1 Tax=Paraliomyxa miuraensis TaxID=376150 RepID=UPI00224D38DE|nr:arginase family protein [Paraliomyxa miuraensis]MCX4247766.1 arginase family protein [Paraliomyxa miuraensis]